MRLPILVKNKKGEVIETRYKINPAFERIIAVSKNTGKAASDLLGIKDAYVAFCLNEAALYVYSKLTKGPEESGNEILKNIAKRK